MITLSGVTKSFGSRILFEGASLQVGRDDRIGLVGPNGAGKSTLFSILLGRVEPDAGAIAIDRRVTLGHLPQETAPAGEETVLQVAAALTPELAALQAGIKAIEAGSDGDAHDLHEVQARFEALGGYRIEPRAKTILHGLAFRERDFDRPLRTMSGGWIMRAHLARLLVQQPDVLLLDEPTNHLDLEALEWFQGFLMNYPGAILLISHDREFLNQLVGHIVEIRQRCLVRYRGNYNEYLAQRAAQEEQRRAAWKAQQRKIRQLQDFADRFRAKNTKASQAQSKLKQIERMDKIEAPEQDHRSVHFRFPQPARSGHRVIALRGVDHAYGEQVVYRGLDFEVERGQRMVLVGPNGAGKSTLLKLLAGVVPIQAGVRDVGLHVKAGYYAQHRVEMLRADRTVLAEALDTPQPLSEEFARTVLGSFLFGGDDVFKSVSVLSGGEKSRLALVKLLLDPPNLLLMDEPTTHLDLSSVDALIRALEPFEGTVLFISHDVYFIRRIARQVLHVNAGRLTLYPGGYDYYLGRKDAQPSECSARAAARAPSPEKVRKRLEAERRQAHSRERRALARAVDRLEADIMRMEARQLELTAELENPATYGPAGRAVAVNRELTALSVDLAAAATEWEIGAERLEALDRPLQAPEHDGLDARASRAADGQTPSS